MSLIEPEEIRYASISAFGLIVFTTLLKWSGLGNTRYDPIKPNSGNVTDVGNRSALETLMEPSLTGGPGSGVIDAIIDIVLTPIQIPVDLILMWVNVWDAMGMMSMFIIVPMFVMFVIVAGVAVKLVSVIIPG